MTQPTVSKHWRNEHFQNIHVKFVYYQGHPVKVRVTWAKKRSRVVWLRVKSNLTPIKHSTSSSRMKKKSEYVQQLIASSSTSASAGELASEQAVVLKDPSGCSVNDILREVLACNWELTNASPALTICLSRRRTRMLPSLIAGARRGRSPTVYFNCINTGTNVNAVVLGLVPVALAVCPTLSTCIA